MTPNLARCQNADGDGKDTKALFSMFAKGKQSEFQPHMEGCQGACDESEKARMNTCREEMLWCFAVACCGALNNLGSERSHLFADQCVLAPALCGRIVDFFCAVLEASLCDATGIPNH